MIGIGAFVYYQYFYNKELIDYSIDTNYSADVDELYIYGTKLNIKGNADISNLEKIDNVKLLFNGSSKIEVDVNYEINDGYIDFYLSNEINGGYNLEKYDLDVSYMYLEIFSGDDVFYYKMDNKTKYKSSDYYYIKKNKKLNISTSMDTLSLSNHSYSTKVYDFESFVQGEYWDFDILFNTNTLK